MKVRYRVPWSDSSDAWAKAARGYTRALQSAGAQVWLDSPYVAEAPENLPWRRVSPSVLAEVEHALPPLSAPDVTVLSTTLGPAGAFSGGVRYFAKNAEGASVLYTTFEREQVEPDLAAALNEVDGVWVPCSWNKDVLVRAGVDAERVLVAGHVYFDDEPLLRVTARPVTTPLRLYWIGRWEPRKAPHNLVRAFLRAFSPGEATLTLKVGPVPWRGWYPLPEQATSIVADRWSRAAVDGSVRVVRGRLSAEQMVEIHAEHDVYASASRGEGWDFPSFEAKLSGHRVVTTDSGGPRDFLGAEDIVVPRNGLVAVAKGYEWGQGACWGDYSLPELSAGLRRALASPSRPVTRQHLEQFRAENVGRRLRAWFEELVRRRSVH